MSYRERLRAGGRGAFQRAMNAGLMPKNMKQEWCQQPQQLNNNMAMQCDGQQMWNTNWQQGQMQMQPTQQMQCQPAQMPVQMMPQMQAQPSQFQQPMQMMSMECMQEPQMQAPQAQVQMFEMPMCQMQTPIQSGESTPTTEVDRCMAIIMPQQSPFGFNDDLAAQLQAAADCQRYED